MNLGPKLTTQHNLQVAPRDLRERTQQSECLDESMVLSSRRKTSPNDTLVVDLHHQSPAGLARKAAEQLALRKRRKTYFPDKMFGEPAWDILIDLYCHETAGKPVSVSSVCVAGGAAHATGLRWLKYLTDAGYIRREPDTKDLRYDWVRLEPEGRRRIEAYLKSI